MRTIAKYAVCICIGFLAEAAGLLCELGATFVPCGHAPPLPPKFAYVFPLEFIISPHGDAQGFSAALLGITTLMQMPFYGWILGNGWVHKRFLLTLLLLAALHYSLALFGLHQWKFH